MDEATVLTAAHKAAILETCQMARNVRLRKARLLNQQRNSLPFLTQTTMLMQLLSLDLFLTRCL
jgi:hypothetical protein